MHTALTVERLRMVSPTYVSQGVARKVCGSTRATIDDSVLRSVGSMAAGGRRTRHGRPRAEVGVRAIEALRREPEGLTKAELVRRVGDTTLPTMQRALTDLKEDHDAPIEFDRSTLRWVLRDPSFSLPLEAPEPDDLTAVLFAEAMLAPLADTRLRDRLRRLAEQLDARLRAAGRATAPPTSAVTASLSLGAPVDHDILARLLATARRQVLRMSYYSPWTGRRARYTIEPWGLRIHDGTLYLRGYCREKRLPTTYRVVQIESLSIVPGGRPSAPAPAPHVVWTDGDPAFGIDHDRPDTATIVVRGPVARWLSPIQWHPDQRDRWLTPNERLQRILPYSSCRELARRLLTVLDALESIDPPALRKEVEGMLAVFSSSNGKKGKR